MRHIDDANVQTRYSSGLARAIELMCPQCLKINSFEMRPWQEHGQKIAAAEAQCGRCDQILQLVQLLGPNGQPQEQALFAHPAPASREPMSGIEHLQRLSPALGRTYASAMHLYNRGDWAPAVLTIRHLLQGLAVQLVPQDKHELPLSQLLQQLARDVDLSRPLEQVVSLLTENKSLGHEFDEEDGVGQANAVQLVELMEQLINYLVVAPGIMAEIKRRDEHAPVPLRRPGQG